MRYLALVFSKCVFLFFRLIAPTRRFLVTFMSVTYFYLLVHSLIGQIFLIYCLNNPEMPIFRQIVSHCNIYLSTTSTEDLKDLANINYIQTDKKLLSQKKLQNQSELTTISSPTCQIRGELSSPNTMMTNAVDIKQRNPKLKKSQ